VADYTALYDACCLYPNALRDTLIRLTLSGLFQAKWTEQINDEWTSNLIKNGGDPARIQRTRELMNKAVPDCLVTGYESLIEQVTLPDPNDRHVLAAAIVGHADVLVNSFVLHSIAPTGARVQDL
jgi:hypothetical protein